MISDNAFITVLDACTLARVSRRTIYNWMDAGKLPFIRTIGGSRRIDPADLFRAPGARTTQTATSPSAPSL